MQPSFLARRIMQQRKIVGKGIRFLGPARSSIIGSIDPVFSIAFAVTLLGERLAGIQILGGILILAGVMWVRVQSIWRPQHPPAAIPQPGEIRP